jgi:beta-glucosidase
MNLRFQLLRSTPNHSTTPISLNPGNLNSQSLRPGKLIKGSLLIGISLLGALFAGPFLFSSCTGPQESPATGEGTRDFSEFYESSIDSIIGLLTLDEKIALLHGNGKFTSAGVERLGIPELKYTDGPFGIREELMRDSWAPAGWTNDSATFLPTGTALAATWNPDLARDYGTTLGSEARKRNKDIFLGPAVNIIRTPLNGRNFEYLSEDPLLNARLSVSCIEGVQNQDVAACVKHFVANNQETRRSTLDVIMDERTLREIYLPAFRASVVEAKVFSVMGSYNKLLGSYCCENSFLLNDILKEEWGFKGAVISDWSATKSTIQAAESGLDIEMGTNGPYNEWYFADPLKEAVLSGQIDTTLIDNKVRRVLRIIFNCRVLESDRLEGSINTTEHSETAYRVASEAVVLLKNEGNLLPLKTGELKSIAVIGDNAVRTHARGGFGTTVKAKYEITPLEGLRQALPENVTIRYARGYEKTTRMANDGRLRIITIKDQDPRLIEEAVQAAKDADLVIFFGGLNHDFDTEGIDREDYGLPYGQDKLIREVARANPNTILVIIAGSPVDLSEVEPEVPAILWGWLNGCEAGHALADVILGRVNPSGKLPFTIPRSLEDSPTHALGNFPGDGDKTEYSEGILVGYRWYDTKNIDPLYCFGHGLSYSTFSLNSLKTDMTEYDREGSVSVRVHVKNEGPLPGMQTIQLYVGGPGTEAGSGSGGGTGSYVPKPLKELRAFEKILLNPGDGREITFRIYAGDLAYFDNESRTWITEQGTYTLYAGFSSRDIRQVTRINIQ